MSNQPLPCKTCGEPIKDSATVRATLARNPDHYAQNPYHAKSVQTCSPACAAYFDR